MSQAIINKTRITGKIVEIDDTGRKIVFTIQTTTKNRLGKLNYEYPTVTFTDQQREMIDGFKVYDFVYIEGDVVSYRESTEDKKSYICSTIKGSAMTASLDTMGDERLNEVIVKGEIVRKNIPNDKFSSMTIKYKSQDDKDLYVIFAGYGNAASFIKRQLDIHDIVTVKGSVQTSINAKNGKRQQNGQPLMSVVCGSIDRTINTDVLDFDV